MLQTSGEGWHHYFALTSKNTQFCPFLSNKSQNPSQIKGPTKAHPPPPGVVRRGLIM